MPPDQVEGPRGLEVAHDHDRGGVRAVVAPVVAVEGVPRHVLDVAPPADDRPLVRMSGEGRGDDLPPEEPPGVVLAPFQLAPHHRHLGVEVGLVDPAVHHPVGLEPDRQLEAVGGHGLVVVRPVEVGARVEGGAVQEEQARDLADAELLRALEHHVLEEVRDARDPGMLVSGADLVPDAEAHHGGPVDLLRQDAEPVGQDGLPDARGEGGARRGSGSRRGGLRPGPGHPDGPTQKHIPRRRCPGSIPMLQWHGPHFLRELRAWPGRCNSY